MTRKELYYYMLAYQQEHQFTHKGQSNFIAMLKSLYSNEILKKEDTVSHKNQDHD